MRGENKHICNIINVMIFLCLYFGKINLAIGKIRTDKNSIYINKKTQLKNNTSDTHKKNKINHHPSLLGGSGSGDLSVWSNSFNFAKSGNSVVDPRTGMLMVSIKASLLQSNFGHGPDIDL